jgi:hypothetical protein
LGAAEKIQPFLKIVGAAQVNVSRHEEDLIGLPFTEL